MQIRCHFDATILIYKHFEVFLKSDTHGRRTPSQLVLSRKWQRQTKTRRTDRLYKFVFSSGLTLIGTVCQLKSTKRYKNVSRALTYTWYGRFSDGSTDNTSRGLLTLHIKEMFCSRRFAAISCMRVFQTWLRIFKT